MDIVLINPPWYKPNQSIWKKISSCFPSLGLGYIAGCAEKSGFSVQVIDVNAEKIAYDEVVNRVKRYNPRFVGLTATTQLINNSLLIASMIKEKLPKTKIVLGGPHPSIFTDEILKHKAVDYVIRNEGEESIVELLSGVAINKIGGLSYKEGSKHFHNLDRGLIQNLDQIPFPAYHLFPMDKYHPALGNYKRLPAMSIITTRGCPGNCTFCYKKMFGNKIRTRSAENILEEIELLINNYRIKEISFYDDTFTSSRTNVLKFCELIVKKNVDITWSCMSRVDFIDEELLKAMKNAGCHQICYGIESGEKEILFNIRKNISFEKAQKVIDLTKKARITARATFMFGSPGETEESMEKTMQASFKLNPDMVIFNITTPFPGTAMYEWAKKNGYLLTENWDEYDLSKPVMKLPTVETEKVIKYYKNAHKKFYLRLRYILGRIFRIRSINDLVLNIKAFYAIITQGN